MSQRTPRSQPARETLSPSSRTWIRRLRAAAICCLYLILLTPLANWNRFLFPDLSAKIFSFQILIELAAAAALIAALLERRSFAWRQAGSVAGSVVLLYGYTLISSILGADLNRSLWGFIDRQDGLVQAAHFISWMLLLAWMWRSPSGEVRENPPGFSIYPYLSVSYLVSLAVSARVLWEGYQAAPKGMPVLTSILESSARPAGGFGNPTFVGPYLLFHFFFGVYLVADASRRWGGSRPARAATYALAAGGDLLILAAIFAGQTRGVILGLALGLAGLALMLLLGTKSRIARFAAAASLLVLASGSAALWRYRDSEAVRRVPVLQRISTWSASENASTLNRLYGWRSALRGFADDPVFGCGFNNVYYVLNTYYDPRQSQFSLNLTARDTMWWDKSHNYYIDLLVERGILGVLFFALFVYAVVDSLRGMKNRPLAWAAAAGLTGYATSMAVAFDGFGSLFGLFLALALIAAYSPPIGLAFRSARRPAAAKPKQPKTPAPPRSPALAAAGVVGALAACLYLNFEIAAANHKYLLARNLYSKDPAAAIERHLEGFRHYSPYEAREKLYAAYFLVNSALMNVGASRNIEGGGYVLEFTRDALATHPLDAEFYIMLNDLYNGLALRSDARLLTEAESYGKKAVELSPARQEALINLGRTYIIKNEPKRAIEINGRVVQHYPELGAGHWFLGLSLLADGQRDPARREIRRALDLGYRFQSEREVKAVQELFGPEGYAELMKGR